ncbi:recombinase zinc beta ribbon domain-containing protein [Corynebacterium pygosceleis]|uniref:recombinase zinc beta ribbon domain-containing protein n=1 Tax=Corynebacterium pygosceleis TaxID=2800406 RepID=UPI002B21E44F|nr:recombinase zinc beta ribbon domain-containing protein [Corynebacterium pygosceleis]
MGSHEWLLTGLQYCQCGDRLYGHNKTGRRASGEKNNQYTYRCMANRKRGHHHCETACTVDATQSEAYVLGWYFAQLTDEAVAQARARRDAATSHRALKDLFVALEEPKQNVMNS